MKLFQSLFFWNHCLDIITADRKAMINPVSILVFLEPLLRLNLLRDVLKIEILFQSLFFWNHCLDRR